MSARDACLGIVARAPHDKHKVALRCAAATAEVLAVGVGGPPRGTGGFVEGGVELHVVVGLDGDARGRQRERGAARGACAVVGMVPGRGVDGGVVVAHPQASIPDEDRPGAVGRGGVFQALPVGVPRSLDGGGLGCHLLVGCHLVAGFAPPLIGCGLCPCRRG